jgi:hypothetical protein
MRPHLYAGLVATVGFVTVFVIGRSRRRLTSVGNVRAGDV